MNKKKLNNRQKMFLNIGISIVFIAFVVICSCVLPDSMMKSNIQSKNLSPSFQHLFGTDWLGRDMFIRTVKGLRLSMSIGLITSCISVFIALILGGISALGGKIANQVIAWLVDLFIGMPHIVFMILLSFLIGGGRNGIILGVGLTHWPTLSRIIRSEILKIKSENYITISRKMGKGNLFIFRKHILPHLIPVSIVGFVILFPHVILHEAALTFLGFGLSPQTPAMGIILSEGMGNISSGKWWLILFPAIVLISLVKSFDSIGDRLEVIIDPSKANE
ncbi:ABC transporter permease [Fusobacterium necrophorum]|uniref:ABC transporter permease n=1 Tax=Fusobacterium necrophorum TaxID=859 RepID=UPI00254ECBB8|nr:ABC transporter permease [Fusobacterium necrophorum]MDK4501317.1 ABC transporter permease [Fusobacterium necrophorum]